MCHPTYICFVQHVRATKTDLRYQSTEYSDLIARQVSKQCRLADLCDTTAEACAYLPSLVCELLPRLHHLKLSELTRALTYTYQTNYCMLWLRPTHLHKYSYVEVYCVGIVISYTIHSLFCFFAYLACFFAYLATFSMVGG